MTTFHYKPLSLDLEQIKQSCYQMEDLVKRKMNPSQIDEGASTYAINPTTIYYSSYNIFLYPYDGFYELFEEVRTMFRETFDVEGPFYMQAWVNIFRKGEFIDWHMHKSSLNMGYLGYYGINCEGSRTTYICKNNDGSSTTVEVGRGNNVLMMHKDVGDVHKTWPWPHDDEPRMTIPFVIIPKKFVDPEEFLNHWIPV